MDARAIEETMAEIYCITGNVIGFYQDLRFSRPENLKVEIIHHELSFIQSVTYKESIYDISVGNFLDIGNWAFANQPNQHASNYLELRQSVTRSKFGFASNLLAMTHSARTVLHYSVEDQLEFTQNVDVTRGLHNTFIISQTLDLIKTKMLTPTNTFIIDQSVSVYKANDPTFVLL